MVEGSRYFCEHVSPYNHTKKDDMSYIWAEAAAAAFFYVKIWNFHQQFSTAKVPK